MELCFDSSLNRFFHFFQLSMQEKRMEVREIIQGKKWAMRVCVCLRPLSVLNFLD